MSILLAKVWSDISGHKLRTALVVLSIAIGVTAVGAIFGIVDQLIGGMDAAHVDSNPAHVQIWTNGAITQPTLERLRKLPGVESIEASTSLTVRYRSADGGPWRSGSVFIADDYRRITMDKLTLTGGDWPTAAAAAVERSTDRHLGFHIGDRVMFSTDLTTFSTRETAGRVRTVTLGGRARHPFIPTPLLGGPAYFLMNADMAEDVFGIARGNYNTLFVRVAPYSQGQAERVADAMRKTLGQENVRISVVLHREPDKHWGRPIVEGITFVLQLMALSALLASSIIVTNTMNALIAEQIYQIGIIKAIGGKSLSVIAMYAVSVLIYGIVAFIIAAPLGALAAFFATQSFLDLFNIAHDEFIVSPRAIGLQALCAFAAPLLAAFAPILRAGRTTVREALASYGLSGAGAGASQLAARITGALPPVLALAVGSAFRRIGRLLLTQGVLIIAGAMFITGISLAGSVNATLDAQYALRDYDLGLEVGGLTDEGTLRRAAQSVPGVAGYELRLFDIGALFRRNDDTKGAGIGMLLEGVPSGSRFYIPPLIAGRWLGASDQAEIVVHKAFADEHGVALGDWVKTDLGALGLHEWRVVGVFAEAFRSNTNIGPNSVYVSQSLLWRRTGLRNAGNRIYVRTTPGADIDALLERLTSVLEEKGVTLDVFESKTLRDDRAASQRQADIPINMFFMLATTMAAVGGIGLMGALAIGVIERGKEIGVLRAIGATSLRIAGLFTAEALIQGVLSWMIAAPLSLLIAERLARKLGQIMLKMDLTFAYSDVAAGVWLAIVLVTALAAAIIPARNANRISVRASLDYAS